MICASCDLTRAATGARENHDRLCNLPRVGFFVVADGVGRRPGAAAASALAVETLRTLLARCAIQPDAEVLQAALNQAQARVRELPSLDSSLAGAATTVTALILGETAAWLLHLGDSRALLYRDQSLRQLTEVHTLAAEVERLGLRAQGASDALGQRLTRCLGAGPDGESSAPPQLEVIRLAAGDWLLLCSDGFSSLLDDAELARFLAARGDNPPAAVCADLADILDARERADDVSVILIRVGD